MLKKITFFILCIFLFPILSAVGTIFEKQTFIEDLTYEEVEQAISSSTPLYGIYEGKKYRVRFIIENNVLVKQAPPKYQYLSDEERKTAEELNIRYQNDVLDGNNPNQLKNMTPEEYFTKEEYSLILRNQKDHELKYIPSLIDEE